MRDNTFYLSVVIAVATVLLGFLVHPFVGLAFWCISVLVVIRPGFQRGGPVQ